MYSRVKACNTFQTSLFTLGQRGVGESAAHKMTGIAGIITVMPDNNVQKRQIIKQWAGKLNMKLLQIRFLQNFILKYFVKSLKRTGIIEKKKTQIKLSVLV